MTVKSIFLAVIVAVSCIQKSHAIPDDSLPAYTIMSGIVSGGAVASMMLAAGVDLQKSVIVGLLTGVTGSALVYRKLEKTTSASRYTKAQEIMRQVQADLHLLDAPANYNLTLSIELVRGFEEKVNHACFLVDHAINDAKYAVKPVIGHSFEVLIALNRRIAHMYATVAYQDAVEKLQKIRKEPLLQVHSEVDDVVKHALQVHVSENYPLTEAFQHLKRCYEVLTKNNRALQGALPKILSESPLIFRVKEQQQQCTALEKVVHQKMCAIRYSTSYKDEQRDQRTERNFELAQARLAIQQLKAEAALQDAEARRLQAQAALLAAQAR